MQLSIRTLALSGIVGLICACLSPDQTCSAEDQLPTAVSFNSQIRPLLNQHCAACHGGVKQAADLSFVYPDAIAEVVEAGDPENSLLLERVIDPDEESRMPPPEHGRRLNADEVDLLTRWIAEGAQWGKHWAYETPVRHAAPAVKAVDWVRKPVDAFVLKRLEYEGLSPSPGEKPHRWLRRVSFDLIGLPPTLEQRRLFEQDLSASKSDAESSAVDRLLASRRFGERWASVWFDLVRYADSKGLGLDDRRTIWAYRDWVIRSLNDDLPYDQFTIKQIAGDLLPAAGIDDRVATAVHRLTQTNDEGGTDDEEFRVAAVLDRVNTVWQTWQGTSFGCAQCHHHPYDPFEHEDYYSFAAFFNNTADSDLQTEWPLLSVPNNVADFDRAAKLDQEIEELKEQIWQEQFAACEAADWQPLQLVSAASNNATRLTVGNASSPVQFHTVGTVSHKTSVIIVAALNEDAEDDLNPLTAIRLTALPLNPQTAIADSEWGFVLSHVVARIVSTEGDADRDLQLQQVIGDEPFPHDDPAESLNPKSAGGFSAFTRIHHQRRAVLVFAEPVEMKQGERLEITLKHSLSSGGSHPLMIHRGYLEVTADEELQRMLVESRPDLRSKLETLKRERAAIPSTKTPVLRERPLHLARPSHVFERGLFLTKGKLVSASVPGFLRQEERIVDDRLQLAHWLVDDANPLTARVAVNRVWARLFGIGLVATEEDFGSSGAAPSHPQLLDDLAVRFRDDYRWSLKRLLRELVLSHTYRQSAKIPAEMLQRDPQNRLLARGPRQTLSAEMVRDQALAISGLLSDKMYGPPVRPPIPAGLWKPFAGGDKWETAKRGEPDRYRRSVYVYTKRSIPFPIQATFDAPSREFCEPRRLRSNTPLQPLMTLNDEAFVECAEALAARMIDRDTELQKQIAFGFQLATCRDADQTELKTLSSLYQAALSSGSTDKDADRAGLAMQAVAAVLLNLDEVLTK